MMKQHTPKFKELDTTLQALETSVQKMKQIHQDVAELKGMLELVIGDMELNRDDAKEICRSCSKSIVERISKIQTEIAEINTDYYVSAEDLIDLEEDLNSMLVVDEVEISFPQKPEDGCKTHSNGGKA